MFCVFAVQASSIGAFIAAHGWPSLTLEKIAIIGQYLGGARQSILTGELMVRDKDTAAIVTRNTHLAATDK